MKQTAGLVSIVLLTVLLFVSAGAQSQPILGRNVSFVVNRQQLGQVLEILSNKGNFYFSYNSNIIKGDSLVTLNIFNQTVKQVMEKLFPEGYEYRESGNYIILRKAPIKASEVTGRTASEEKYYYVSGYILDDQTGEIISHASIYEKNQLASAMSDRQGYFKLKLKSRYNQASLTVSKELYVDTTFTIQPRFNQQMTVAIMPLEVSDKTITITPYTFEVPDSIVVAVRKADSSHWIYTYRKADSSMVDKTQMGNWVLSTWQKLQAINLKKFFTVRPYQLSLLPGLSTNGRLNSQVINNVSINVWGGYSGGVNGVELGGLFNIDNKSVRWAQAAGIFNVVGGMVEGAQLAGISNTVLDSVHGVQAAGISNFTKRNFSGAQLGGIYNHVGGTMQGVQAAGIGNFGNGHTVGAQLAGILNVNRRNLDGAQIAGWVNVNLQDVKGAQIAGWLNVNLQDVRGAQIAGWLNVNLKDVKGAQIAGLMNVNFKEVRGAQIAGLVNYTKKLSGLQIGLVNIADTSDGYSIGLINIVLKGYHKLSLYGNEEFPFNASFKTGNSKLYSILLAGVEPTNNAKAYTFGYGLGREFNLSKKWAVNAEVSTAHVYLGTWDYLNMLTRVEAHINYRLTKWASLFAGPAMSFYYSEQKNAVKGYKANIRPMSPGDNFIGWAGFTAGINLF
ncbi:STN and carboxypeptidase regulatory-like domain-containing protein [Paraflavitalea pollutisoli]|uniref:STN and carboxypeptidase regulatory-like domain-containing protein n=1 Tax=Paraflavitalea pollutisoli TaxID=3034143 RepID=UPI0023EBA036|nr:STN and carboxypeptidase regulatory-like domain-containing protein [Paraflavitalea sp. H1-2-19X]